jgi:hypothetical protein
MRRFFTLVLFAWMMAASVEACPGCKEPVAVGQGSVDNVGKGFSYSVLFMLAMPMILVGSLGTYMARTVRRLDREKSAQVPRT